MSTYIDTSVVVSFFIQDDHADAARRWARTDPSVAISDWTATEFSSALSHHVRLGSLSDRERKAAELAFDRWAMRGVVLEVARERFQDARILMQGHRRLRAPDALHLAIARHEGLPLATLDHDLRDAAVAEGLKVVDL
ncbi:type II toxin-antitoxin system VapC family toxin [Brevundimonas sp. UBA2416]|uniref:type II toxin-antitoxin system VapC family toxin n=1 Tax=Brevundimonas sp. UBA2416 TaxID=1946124 RepID=UPI0025BDE744|nr:type II toxin-antitoxin system VapC family toxin [Brevundimonas sp. UBA2416]HRJ65159.1 type II toxin-antitoxin system VapC family toxin [Brevundimonas sp.]